MLEPRKHMLAITSTVTTPADSGVSSSAFAWGESAPRHRIQIALRLLTATRQRRSHQQRGALHANCMGKLSRVNR